MAGTVPGTILVVSDDPDVADEARFALRDEVTVETAVDATDALRKLALLAPAAVVVDLQTGRAGGYSLAREMSQLTRLSSIPIVMLIEREPDRWIADQAGAEVVLRKPVESGALGRALAQLNS